MDKHTRQIEDLIQHTIDAVDAANIGSIIDSALDGARRVYNSGGMRHGSFTPYGRMRYPRRPSASWTPPQMPRQQPQYTQHTKQPEEYPTIPKPPIQVRYPSQISGVLMVAFGAILTLIFAMTMLGILLANVITGAHTLFAIVISMLFTLGSIAMVGAGVQSLQVKPRLKRYLRAIGAESHCALQWLAQKTGKTTDFLYKDLKKMITKGYLPEGHLDDQGKNLILTEETYQYYLQAQQKLQKQAQEQEAKKQNPALAEFEAMLESGKQYIREIRIANDKLDGPEISAKLALLEATVSKILEAVQKHPEQAKDLTRLMEYYLPTICKLMDAYCEFEFMGVQSNDVIAAKRDIESTLDTINQALENLYHQLFQDMAFDTAADAAVLQSMLARDGWVNDGMTMEENKK